MAEDYRGGFAKIRFMVGPEIEADPLPRPRGGCRKEPGRYHAVLVVPPLRPRIGEQEEHRGELGRFRQDRQKVLGVRLQEIQVVETAPFPFALGTRYALGIDIDSDAGRPGVSGGVGGEEMSMTASDLPNKTQARRNDLLKCVAKVVAPFPDVRAMGR
jgi:hypothetical protein